MLENVQPPREPDINAFHRAIKGEYFAATSEYNSWFWSITDPNNSPLTADHVTKIVEGMGLGQKKEGSIPRKIKSIRVLDKKLDEIKKDIELKKRTISLFSRIFGSDYKKTLLLETNLIALREQLLKEDEVKKKYNYHEFVRLNMPDLEDADPNDNKTKVQALNVLDEKLDEINDKKKNIKFFDFFGKFVGGAAYKLFLEEKQLKSVRDELVRETRSFYKERQKTLLPDAHNINTLPDFYVALNKELLIILNFIEENRRNDSSFKPSMDLLKRHSDLDKVSTILSNEKAIMQYNISNEIAIRQYNICLEFINSMPKKTIDAHLDMGDYDEQTANQKEAEYSEEFRVAIKEFTTRKNFTIAKELIPHFTTLQLFEFENKINSYIDEMKDNKAISKSLNEVFIHQIESERVRRAA